MEVKQMNIDDLVPYRKNPRHNEAAVDKVAASIEEFGFKVPIVVDKDNVIVTGHTRLLASQQLGLDTVPVIQASDLTDEQVKAFRLADNKTAEFAEWDMALLEQELDALLIDMEQFGFEEFEAEGATLDEVYANGVVGSLAEDFIVPPFNILDTRSGIWLERKRNWRDIIGDNGESRDDTSDLVVGNNNMATVSLLDPVLSEIAYTWFAPDVDTPKVFDPFAGDTIFGYVSSFKGGSFTGIEIREEQAKLNNMRLEDAGLDGHYINDDGQNVAKHIEADSQDLLFSCPPYYDLEVYSDLENDASNQESYEEFYKILDNAFKASASLLKENRFAVIVVGDVRNNERGWLTLL